jgi:molybdate transport system substrate-binding protein
MRRRDLKFSSILAIAIAVLNRTAPVDADELKVMAIGAVAPLFRQLIPEFEKQYGIHITATYGPTAELGEKMSKGENVDVMFGAPPFRDRLVKENKIEPGIAFARSGMGIGIRKGMPRPDISTSDALRQSMLETKSLGGLSVGIGLFTKQAIKELKISDEVQSKYHLYPNGTSLLRAMVQGEVDMGFSVIADIAGSTEVEYLGPFPADVQKYITIYAAMAVGTSNSDAARKFIEFVCRPDRSQQYKSVWLEPLF